MRSELSKRWTAPSWTAVESPLMWRRSANAAGAVRRARVAATVAVDLVPTAAEARPAKEEEATLAHEANVPSAADVRETTSKTFSAQSGFSPLVRTRTPRAFWRRSAGKLIEVGERLCGFGDVRLSR